MKIKPLGRRVGIRKIKNEDDYEGGILIPKICERVQVVGEVVILGLGDCSPILLGDVVILESGALSDKCMFDSEETIYINVDDICATVEK